MSKKSLEMQIHGLFDRIEPVLDRANNMTANVNSGLENFNNVKNTFNDIGNKINTFQQFKNEGKQLDIEMQRLKNDLAEIISNHQEKMNIINKVFADRRNVFDNLFHLLERGLFEGSEEAVFIASTMINSQLEKNPLLMIQEYKTQHKKIDFHSGKPLELDF